MNLDMLNPTLPWWRVPTVWLVISGPALVVVASMVTLVLAIRGGDVPLREARESSAPRADAMTPAAKARNHAVGPRR